MTLKHPEVVRLEQAAKAVIAGTLEDATRLIIRPQEQAPADSRFLSHFGGEPYFQKGEVWPQNPANGTPLDLVCQLANDGTRVFPPAIELVQFWYDWKEMPRNGRDSDGWLVKMYTRLRKRRSIRIERPAALPERTFCSVEFQPIKTAWDFDDFSWYKDSFDPNVTPFFQILKELEKYDPGYTEDLDCYIDWVEELTGSYEWDCHMGGCASSVQGRISHWPKESTTSEKRFIDWKLLLQLNPTEHFWMNNFGMIYLFYNPKNDEEVSFGMDFW